MNAHTFNELPNHVHVDILALLDARSLLQIECTSRSWQNKIKKAPWLWSQLLYANFSYSPSLLTSQNPKDTYFLAWSAQHPNYLHKREVKKQHDAIFKVRWIGCAFLTFPCFVLLFGQLPILLHALLSIVGAFVLLQSILKEIRMAFMMYTLDFDTNEEEYGWRLVHGDIFRLPPYYTILSALQACGAGSCAAMSCYALHVAFANFSIWMYGVETESVDNTGDGDWWISACACAWMEAYLNSFISRISYSRAVTKRGVRIGSAFGLATCIVCTAPLMSRPWKLFVIYTPLWILWMIFKLYRIRILDFPCRTHIIPRQIPEYNLRKLIFLGVVAIPYLAILPSVLKYANDSTMLFAAVLPIMLVVVGITTLTGMFQIIQKEDYKWWWISFMAPLSSALLISPHLAVLTSWHNVLLFLVAAMGVGWAGHTACWVLLHKIYARCVVD